MKICACIAEYNPFHLGHLKHLEYIKNTLGAEKLIVVMSGNFCQRGESAILDKFTRAKHAVIAGADLVIELPTVFATANAEIFATGAVNLIDSLGVCQGLCFGVESGEKAEYLLLANAMNNETKEFKKLLKEKLDGGISLAKAKFLTVKDLYGDTFNADLINSPNNVLGLEYTKALIKRNSDIQIYPMKRDGDHNDKTLKKGITSATSIRQAIKGGDKKKIKKNLPPFVYQDIKDYLTDFDKLITASVIRATCDDLKKIADCTEGLENRIKALSKDNYTVDGLVEKVSTKRYTETRIRRILINNLLGIDKKLVDDAVNSPTYAKVLALNSQSKDLIPLIAKNSSIPLLTRKSDTTLLKKTALQVFEKDVLASDLYNLVSGEKQNENQMLII